MAQETILKSSTGERIALQSVHIEGQLDGLLLSTTVRQNYHNDTGKNLEVVYTFPVGWGATLLGMDAEIAGKRLQGVVIERQEAERKYEKAVEQGDTPIMVQQSAPGVFTANLGNIKDKESVGIEIRCAQLLRFEQGRIRIKIPTVIAPRYGDAHKEGVLAPHETDAVDLSARYPLTVHLKIVGETAKAHVTSPSHIVTVSPVEDGLSVILESGAVLDRDFILLLEGLEGHSFALTAQDGEQHMMLASFCPSLPGQEAAPLLLKVLVDCSGSMGGDSIHEAKIALNRVLQELKAGDYFSYSRFGSVVRHESERMESCSEEALQRYAGIVAETDADMGGTAMEKALLSTFRDVLLPNDSLDRPNILLITDDLVWNSEAILQSCIESGHRIFTVGVGSAPAESLLRSIAEKTGGACEFVSPKEDVSAAIVRMFRRMRTAHSRTMKISWGSGPVRQSPLPKSVFDGETIHLFAVFDKAPDSLPELAWDMDGHTHRAVPITISRTDSSDAVRLAGAVWMEAAATKEESLALALKYQLVSRQTSLFLVYLRDGEDKITELPELHQIPQMMAAGSHGYGSVDGFNAMSFMISPILLPQVRCDFDTWNPFRKVTQKKCSAKTPLEILSFFDKEALASTDALDVLRRLIKFAGSGKLEQIIEHMSITEGISIEDIWAILLDWLLERFKSDVTVSRQAVRLLRMILKKIDRSQVMSVRNVLLKEVSRCTLNSWGDYFIY
jgi:Ca-activated chloride channel family protein